MWRWLCSIFAWKPPAQRRREREQQLEQVRQSLERSHQLARLRAATRANPERAREQVRARSESVERIDAAARRLRVADRECGGEPETPLAVIPDTAPRVGHLAGAGGSDGGASGDWQGGNEVASSPSASSGGGGAADSGGGSTGGCD